ncbi:MAG: SDR family NAD(P)-dependent oxidoreductase [Proteobacteria bacterium]|nr:SDR family NAD(P)-dependent oxidoreductase [Pseudomonadota bacterium]
MRPIPLKQKNVLITGASSGIGKELAGCFAAEGANLFMGALPTEKEALDAWAGELAARHGVETHTLAVDLSVPKGPVAMHEAAVSAFGPVEVLVNNAGLLAYGEFAKIPLARQRLMVDVNFSAYLSLMHLCLPDMIAARAGGVLNLVSASALQPTPFHAVYGATKAGMLALSLAVAAEVRRAGVRVTALCPSYVDTPLVRNEIPDSMHWFKISGLATPAYIAAEGLAAFQKGRLVHVPGLKNRIIHQVLNPLMPKSLTGRLGARILGPR